MPTASATAKSHTSLFTMRTPVRAALPRAPARRCALRIAEPRRISRPCSPSGRACGGRFGAPSRCSGLSTVRRPGGGLALDRTKHAIGVQLGIVRKVVDHAMMPNVTPCGVERGAPLGQRLRSEHPVEDARSGPAHSRGGLGILEARVVAEISPADGIGEAVPLGGLLHHRQVERPAVGCRGSDSRARSANRVRGGTGTSGAPQSAAWIRIEFDQAPFASSDERTRLPLPVRSRSKSASAIAANSAMALGWSPIPRSQAGSRRRRGASRP